MKFLPQVSAIASFGDGGFRFGGHSHLGGLLVLPSGMRAWEPAQILGANDFELLIAEKNLIDFFILGTGEDMARPPKNLLAYFAEHRINIDFMSTSSAVHTYNVLLAEKRRVAAAFIAVDKSLP